MPNLQHECGLEYAMVCQRWGDRPVEGECVERRAYDWAGYDSWAKWPSSVFYSSTCWQCGNSTTVSADFQPDD